MNKTEAKFTTTSKGQVAFLLWKDILPDSFESMHEYHLFLYYGEVDFGLVMQDYWKGEVVPACELGECVLLVDQMIQQGEVIKSVLKQELRQLRDYKEWYTQQVTMDDLLGLREMDPLIFKQLEKIEPVVGK